jgi:hypothetical protein
MDGQQDWIVEFGGVECNEAVIRRGTRESVNYPDDLGCPVKRIRSAELVRIKGIPWRKGGEMRVELFL